MAKNRQKAKTNGKKPPQTPENLIFEQKQVLREMRGRRASRLGERIFEDLTLEENVRIKSLAAGHEAYLRELISNGHEEQARTRAATLLSKTPDLKNHWALSLQVRWGLTEICIDDNSWRMRLRSELVDPSDLLQLDIDGLNVQAATLLEAWDKIEQGKNREALEQLTTIGRRSPLVDWRLFLQILVEQPNGNQTDIENILRRMHPGSPAHGAALRAADIKSAENKGPHFNRLVALENRLQHGVLPKSANQTLSQEIRELLKDNRPGLAVSIASALATSLPTPQEFKRFLNVLLKCNHKGFSINRVYLRTIYNDAYTNLISPEGLETIHDENWSKAEQVILWTEVFQLAKREWTERKMEEDDEDLEYIFDGLIGPLLGECKQRRNIIPDFRELYEFWLWALNEMNLAKHEALTAYANAFPDDTEILMRTLLGLANEGAEETQAKALSRLEAQLPPDRFQAFRQTLILNRIRFAFRNNNRPDVLKWAGAYSGTDLMEQIEVAFFLWRISYRGKKAKIGKILCDFKLPWLVYYLGFMQDPSLRVRMLPAGLKRSLSDDPDAVLKGVSQLLEADETKVFQITDPQLVEPVAEALEHSQTSIEPLRQLLPILFMRVHVVDEMIWDSTSGFLEAFRTLLSGGDNDQALVIGLRLMIPVLEECRIKEEATERSFRVAWTLAEEPTRKLLYRIYGKCGFPQRQFPNKTAPKKMIDAELKMQRKFSDKDQIIRRFAIEETFENSMNPFDFNGNFENKLEKIRQVMEKMSPGEFEEQLNDLANRLGLDPNNPYGYDEEEDEWEEPIAPRGPTASKPYIFSPHPPTMELEYMRIISEIQATTRGQHRLDAADQLKKICLKSKLGDNARGRILLKIEQIKMEVSHD